MEDQIHKIICPLCESKEIISFTKKRNFDIYKCLECKLLFIFPLPKSIDVYDKSYFSGAERGYGYVDYDTDKEPMVFTFKKYLEIFSKLGFKNGKLLDVGCATGFFMSIAKENGFEVFGVELSEYASDQGKNKGLNIINGDIFTPKFSSEYFDIITMFDVIEHIPDPKSALMEARRILKKGGLLVINTPDAQSLWAKVLGSNWQLIMPPEHIHYFSPNNLGNYLSSNGFSIVFDSKIGKSFTIQYILKMLYKWTSYRIFASKSMFKKLFSRISIPINLRDNFFMIVKKMD